jgi:hypothetical protein
MIKALTVYILSQAAVLFWFYSPLKLSLFKLFTKRDSFDHGEFDVLLLSKSSVLQVLTCTFCFGFWTSIIVSSVISYTISDFFLNTSTSIVLLYLYEQIINFLKRVD